jgi:hypothetical protein
MAAAAGPNGAKNLLKLHLISYKSVNAKDIYSINNDFNFILIQGFRKITRETI